MEAKKDEFEVSKWKVMLGIVVAIGVIFACGFIGNFYVRTVGANRINVERKNFEGSKSRLHGIANDLAKYKFELATEKDPIARKAICNLIIDMTSSLDINDLENRDLAQFVKDVQNGKYLKEKGMF